MVNKKDIRLDEVFGNAFAKKVLCSNLLLDKGVAESLEKLAKPSQSFLLFGVS